MSRPEARLRQPSELTPHRSSTRLPSSSRPPTCRPLAGRLRNTPSTSGTTNTLSASRCDSLGTSAGNPHRDADRVLQLPFNNACHTTTSLTGGFNIATLEVARPPTRHVKQTLPPSLTGYPGEAEIRYYVKCTVNRPSLLKENPRAVSRPRAIPARMAKLIPYSLCISTSSPSNLRARRRPMVKRMRDVNTSSIPDGFRRPSASLLLCGTK